MQFQKAPQHYQFQKAQLHYLEVWVCCLSSCHCPSASGFGWNDEGKFVTCLQTVWDDWVKMDQLYYNFVWTDERAKLLIDTYHSYLEHDANELRDFDSRERCLEKLKTVFNEENGENLEEEENGENLEEENGKNHTLKAKAVHIIHYYSEKKATDDAITSKLDEFATTYLKKYEDEIKYGELKKILKEKWSQFKLLVQHEKFEYYRPLNAPPLARCATRLKVSDLLKVCASNNHHFPQVWDY